MKHSAIYFAGLLMLLLAACDKDPAQLASENGISDQIASEEAFSEAEMAFVQTIVDAEEQSFDGVIKRENGLLGGDPEDSTLTPPCATRTWTGDSTHRVLTIDFGTEPCLCRDGNYRSGKIITHFIGPRREIGSRRIVTFEDYVVNEHAIGGTRTTTYLGDATFRETVADGFITFNDTTSTWNAENTIRIIHGFDTRDPSDDVIRITGRREGTNRLGISYTTHITEPLIRKTDPRCVHAFIDGVRETETSDGHTIILDFDPVGGAPCDLIARLTVDGVSRIIHLR